MKKFMRRLVYSKSMMRARVRLALALSALLTARQLQWLSGVPAMAGASTNEVFVPGYHLSLVCSHPAAPVSGGPVRIGKITGVAEGAEGAGGNGATQTSVYVGPGVFSLSVDDDAGTGIAVGDAIYYQDGATGTPATNLNNNATTPEAFFGYALEAIAANGTATIRVLHTLQQG